ncbi:methylmalonate-semialdehyde dehydrogenase [acylating], mitochondrial-like isoform X2 [Quercus robur]|uniref:methylmalonate-semialdehyde dehydrogenase [acylating], mitochondrial-like isoform X2 n=1 Tax=Quercus robur TaxID=38942 RepID=UPI0021615DB1|nr:methylmalonate-semialdehyde dehydrogenase [acylating], mitochondrial-like isoform X2 [Quercus robur]
MLWISLKIHTRGIQIKDLKEGAAVMLAELAVEADLPNGVLNIVHGSNEIVNAICDDDDVKAISFAGLNVAGTYVYARASAKGKRIQSNVGAKNHAVVMPDASMDATSNALVAAGFGAAGQKCTALSIVVLRKFDRQGSKQGNFPVLVCHKCNCDETIGLI